MLLNKRKKSRENNEKPIKRKSKNGQVMVVTYLFVLLFIGLIGYLLYFMVVDSKDVINNSYNQRQNLLAKRVVRGKIISGDGKVLAETRTNSDGSETRNYPFGSMFAHVVGHSTEGKTGIELMENFNLLTASGNPINNLQLRLEGKKTIGDNAVTTLQTDLQKVAYDALGDYRGAVVVSEPSTGKILAMVSKPDYDPNPGTLDMKWNSLVQDTDKTSCLLNRATQGLYPPGSTFKIFTALEYVREHKNYNKFRYDCKGTESQDGFMVNCYQNHVHGLLNLKTAFAKSCNSCFAYLGTQLNIDKYRKNNEQMFFNRELPTSFVYKKSSFVLSKKSNKEEVMHTAMGQGKTQITPLHLNMVTAAIANKGVMMKSYAVDHLETSDGSVVRKYEPKAAGNIMSEDESKILTSFMKEVISSGTATSLSGFSYSVAGKTGSAEYDASGNSHAWFTGFAPADNPRVAVTVVVEGMGTGSEYAVPIAKRILQSYLGN
ncbi:MAG: penicillin-binding protein 2 [Lachnospiraceae bacterium]|jgi:peptidoglycan glycosyltransferase|nr:penicillin-binding protein 2 [Lachnospiraceae bacterium]